MGIFGQGVSGGIIDGINYAADCYFHDRAIQLDRAVLSVGLGVLSGLIGGSGANKDYALNNSIDYAKQVKTHLIHRANQEYAQKAIAKAILYRNDFISYTAWTASIRFAAGNGIANGILEKYNNSFHGIEVPS